MNMDDPSRKRADRTELGLERSKGPEDQTTIPKGNELALVPFRGGVVSPPPTRDLKRTKTGGSENDGQGNMVKNLAGSFEGCRPAQ